MTAPFNNCRFQHCDLPGQCQAEGKCHHPMPEPQKQSALDRYKNDPLYKQVVDTMESLILTHQLTPSEMREAAVLASINYEMTTIQQRHIPLTPELRNRLKELHDMIDRQR